LFKHVLFSFCLYVLAVWLQHYGYTFNYRTLMLDYNKPAPAIPASCVALTARFQEAYTRVCAEDAAAAAAVEEGDGANTGGVGSETPAASRELVLNQLTVNEYLPGQGIASHTGLLVVVAVVVRLFLCLSPQFFCFFLYFTTVEMYLMPYNVFFFLY
jgi:hypothetical protein